MAIFDGAADGQEEIFPDPRPAAIEHGWHDGVIKTLERQNAAAVQAVPFSGLSNGAPTAHLQLADTGSGAGQAMSHGVTGSPFTRNNRRRTIT
jgi:hypothetical protein